MKFSYFPGNIYQSIAIGELNIEQLVNSIREPKPETKEILAKIRAASAKKDYELKHKLKAKLFYVTPAVHIMKGVSRRYTNINYFTGYMQLDWDKLKTIQEAKDFRDYIFNQYETIATSFVSPSGLGVKAIMRIPRVQDIEEYKDFHKGVEDEMNQYDGWDSATKNCVLPMFIAEDPNIKYREDPLIWSVKGDRTVDYKHLNKAESEWGRQRSHESKSLFTVAHFKEKMEAIVDGDGHPRLRAACLVLGSRAGAGYIDVQQAQELAHYMIETNPYLRKKLNTYLKTADWCLSQGYTNPSYY